MQVAKPNFSKKITVVQQKPTRWGGWLDPSGDDRKARKQPPSGGTHLYLTPAGRKPGDRRKLQSALLQMAVCRAAALKNSQSLPGFPKPSHQPPSGGTHLYLSPVGRSAQQSAQTPTGFAQERYHTAGRVLQVRADRRVLAYATGGSSAARRVPAKRDRSVNKKNSNQCELI